MYLINVIAQGIGRVFSLASNLAVFVIIARLGGVELFGQYTYILVFLGICVVVAEFGTTGALTRDIAQIKGSASEYWANFLFLRLFFSISVAVIAVAVAYYIRRDIFFSLAIGLLFLPSLASRFFEPVFQVYHRPWFSTYSAVCYALCYLVFSIIVLIIKKSLLFLVLAFGLANLAYMLCGMYFSLKVLTPRFKFNIDIVKKILFISIPLGIASFLAMVSSKAPVFLLAGLKSDYEVGIYNAAYRFVDLVALLAVMLAAPIVPIFSRDFITNIQVLKKKFMVVIEMLAVLTVPVAISTSLYSHSLITLLFGEKFLPSAGALDILAWACVLIFYSLFNSAILLAIGVVKPSCLIAGFAAATSIALNHLFIPRYGILGSAWTAIICEIIFSGLSFYYIIKHVGNVFRWRIWLKIVCINIAVFMFLFHFNCGLKPFVLIPIVILGYLLAIFVFGIIGDDVLALCNGHPVITKIINKLIYYSGFIYSKQLKFSFPVALIQQYISSQWNLPDGYMVCSPNEKCDLQECAELLNSDKGFGRWDSERVKTEIIDKLIAPDAGSLVYCNNKLVGCSFTSCYISGKSKRNIGILMWLLLKPEHRKLSKGLATILLFRTLAYFTKYGYNRIVGYTNFYRYPALRFYLMVGAKPEYNSITSAMGWFIVEQYFIKNINIKKGRRT